MFQFNRCARFRKTLVGLGRSSAWKLHRSFEARSESTMLCAGRGYSPRINSALGVAGRGMAWRSLQEQFF